MKEIAVVIVTFGRNELLNKTLNSYFANTNTREASLTVVDNGSQQPVLDTLLRRRSDIDSLVFLNENRGKPYALNTGAAIAFQEAKAVSRPLPKHILFCDSDVMFHKNWLSRMVTTYENHKVLDNDVRLGALGGHIHPPHNRDPKKMNLQIKNGTQVNVMRMPAGCCLMLSVDMFLKNGPWDTKRLIRTVDTSYMRNMCSRGYMNAAIHPATVIEHIGGKARTWNISNGKPKYIK